MANRGAYSEDKVKDVLGRAGYLVGGTPGGVDLDVVFVHPLPTVPGGVAEVKSTQNEDKWYPRQHAREVQIPDALDLSVNWGHNVLVIVHYKSGARDGRLRAWHPEQFASFTDEGDGEVEVDSPLVRGDGMVFEDIIEPATQWAEELGWRRAYYDGRE